MELQTEDKQRDTDTDAVNSVQEVRDTETYRQGTPTHIYRQPAAVLWQTVQGQTRTETQTEDSLYYYPHTFAAHANLPGV